MSYQQQDELKVKAEAAKKIAETNKINTVNRWRPLLIASIIILAAATVFKIGF